MSAALGIRVRADWEALGSPATVGTLSSGSLRGEEVFCFEYDDGWLGGGHELALDPTLSLVGPLHDPTRREANYGVFLDSAPDAWGRFLMDRHEAWEARREDREPRSLAQSDYLLGVHDLHRTGALRFDLGRAVLDDHAECVSPPWKVLPVLANASRRLKESGAEGSPDTELWLRVLMAPGASLGGSRPKACVTDDKDRPWIAKFPTAEDRVDVGAWAGVARELGHRAGLSMAEARIERLGSDPHATFLSRRFDRGRDGVRHHMASAQTLLDRARGHAVSRPTSYLEIAEFIQREGGRPVLDLVELWTRIAFSVGISNTDDHLRNHAFLLETHGWGLAPCFDVNPNPEGTGLTLNISEVDNGLSWDLVHEAAPSFRVKPAQAKKILAKLRAAIATWREVALELEIDGAEIEAMEPAFTRG